MKPINRKQIVLSSKFNNWLCDWSIKTPYKERFNLHAIQHSIFKLYAQTHAYILSKQYPELLAEKQKNYLRHVNFYSYL